MMITDDDGIGSARPFLHVPMTTEEFEPAKPVELSLLAKAFVRQHYDELLPYLQSIAGEGGPITGNPRGDEWKMTFHAKNLAADGDFGPLAALSDDQFRLAMRRAYRSHTKVAVGALMHQGIRLRIEDKRARKSAPEPDNTPEPPHAEAAE
jgi:hypothetical protein